MVYMHQSVTSVKMWLSMFFFPGLEVWLHGKYTVLVLEYMHQLSSDLCVKSTFVVSCRHAFVAVSPMWQALAFHFSVQMRLQVYA